MDDVIERLDVFTVTIPRDVPYLGALGPGEEVNAAGYIVRRRNGTIYPTVDRSVVVRATTRSGLVGWGETYGLVAPGAIHELVDDVIAPILVGRSAHDVEVIWEDLYDLMRVRGYQGGFWLDAMAAVDIALWDIHARAVGLPLCRVLGGQRRETIPAYVSGLPEPTLEARCALAKRFVDQGFDAIKFAGVVSFDGIETEAKALRDAIGPDVKLMVDLHWMYSAAEAVALIRRLEPHDLYFAEAPVKPEDVAGLADVAARVATSIAAGEEWRSVFDARPRLEARAVSIVQPEMGHTGITQFMRIARLAEAHHVRVMPHATIGVGIFAAASLHAAAAVRDLPYHEYQHSILPRSAQLLDGRLSCTAGAFALPEGPGLGVAPNAAFWNHVTRGRQ